MPFKLKNITLDNLSQVTVATSETNVDRSYGRRFTVNLGVESKEVVLKDLFKRAQKLAKQASSASELNEVNRFIGKLEEAEMDAGIIYKGRGDWYKFRTWFHRFFGGAFLGSHLERFEKLKTNVKGKQEKLVEAFKTFYQNKQGVFQSFASKGLEFKVDDQIYDVEGEGSLSADLMLKIQKKKDLGTNAGILVIRNGSLIEYNGKTEPLPPELSIILSEIIKEADAREVKHQELLKSLTLIRAVVSEINPVFRLNLHGKEYITFRNGCHFHIQEKVHKDTNEGLLSINLDPRANGEIEFEGNKLFYIPEGDIPLFDAVLEEAYRFSSSYSGDKIRIIREGVIHIPEWHLNELCKRIKMDGDLSVQFLSEDLTEVPGSDQGGVKRDYLEVLVSSLKESKALFVSAEGSLKLPRILRDKDCKAPIFYCNEDEIATFNNLGCLFQKCYESMDFENANGYVVNLITTGCYFSDALFKAILSINLRELTSNDRAKEETYVKIAKILLAHLDTEGTPYIKKYINFLDLTCRSLQALCESNDSGALAELVSIAGYNNYTDEDGDPLIEKIKENKQGFIDDLNASIFRDKVLVKKLNGVSLGAILDPVYQVAQGFMKANSWMWDIYVRKDPVMVSNKIQGSLDRQKIEKSIVCNDNDSNVIKKAEWIKEWVKEEATDEELKAFLRFVTGGASLPEGKELQITAQALGQPYPTACTCGLGISVSDQMKYYGWKKDKWDGNKKDFIRNLKHAIAVEGFQKA